MKKDIKEAVNITIDEDSKEENKEQTFSLNTGQSGKAEYISENINGFLEAILISSDAQVEISITINGTDINIFNIMSFNGTEYLPLRVSAISEIGENYKDSPMKWLLNDRIRVIVKGPLNANVNFVVRYY